MNKFLVIAVGVVISVHAGCSNDGKTSGETHWLGDCDRDADCSGGARCLCGVCTRTCSNDEDCGGPRPARCFETASPGLAKRCGAAPPGPAICLGVCSRDADCPKGEVCLQGACVAASSEAGVEAGAVDSGPSSGDLATKYVHVDAGIVFHDAVEAPAPRTLIEGADDSLVGLWVEYGHDGTRCTAENPVGYRSSVCMQLEITKDEGRGGYVAGVYWLITGVAAASDVAGPFAPASDAERGYPTELTPREYMDLVRAAHGPVRVRDAASPMLAIRRSHVFEGHVTGNELSFWISPMELWSDWCTMQTPHPFQGNGVRGYRCVPQDATESNTDLGRLVLCSTRFDGDMCGNGAPCDCNKRSDAGVSPLCADRNSACACTARGCTANLTASKETYAFMVAGSTLRSPASYYYNDLRRVSP